MEDRETVEQAAAKWIARRDLGPWTAAEGAALQTWLAESVAHRVAYYRFNATWQEAGRLKALGPPSASLVAIPIWTRLAHLLRARPYATAASFVFAAFIVSGLFWIGVLDRDHYSTVVGGLRSVPMADGSRVTLNTNSEVRIALRGRERLIELEQGEAFFEVAKDPNRPFIVKAGDKRVVAVGTRFSVRREGGDVRVIVSEGIVRFEGSKATVSESEQSLMLKAGAVARTRSDAVLVQQASATDIERSLTWRSGLLSFRDTPLAEAVAEFNRYNQRKIVIEDPAIAAVEIGGIFRSTNVDPFINLLEEAFHVRATAEGERILLSSTERH